MEGKCWRLAALGIWLALGAFEAAVAAPSVSRILVPRDQAAALVRLEHSGLAFGHVGLRDDSLVTEVDAAGLALLREVKIPHRVVVADLIADYARRLSAFASKGAAVAQTVPSEYPVRGMRLGSQTLSSGRAPTGMYTLDEVAAVLDSLREAHPRLISVRASIGSSYEGRAIWMVKISDHPDVDEAEPEILFTGAVHGDEPLGTMALVYFMHYLLEGYGTDPQATEIVESRELYFVPVANPDGYDAILRTNLDANDERTGVDLNRNFGFEWEGANAYQGDAPFSEPETRALRDLCLEKQFRLALNYHDFSAPFLLHPWGHGHYTELPDSAVFAGLGAEMTTENGYPYGQVALILYAAPGNHDDWMYGEQDLKAKIIALSPEIGSGKFPRPDSIFVYTQRMLRMNLVLAEGPGVLPAPEVETAVSALTDGTPETFRLYPAFPNPFNAATTIQLEVPAAGQVRLQVFDVTGRQTVCLVDQEASAGAHRVVWDGRDAAGRPAASGVYVARLQAGTEGRTRKVMLLR